MKIVKSLAFISLSALTLAACGVDNTDKEPQETTSARIAESSTESSSEETDPKLVTDGPLLEVGQYTNDEYFGEIILEKIASPGNPVEFSPGMFVTIESIKILNFTDIPDRYQEDANFYYGFDGNQGYDLQIEYTIENKNDFKVDSTVIDKVILSDGEQVTHDSYSENETYTLEPGAKASNQIAHISIPSSDVSNVKVYISPYNFDTYDSLESQPIEVVFE